MAGIWPNVSIQPKVTGTFPVPGQYRCGPFPPAESGNTPPPASGPDCYVAPAFEASLVACQNICDPDPNVVFGNVVDPVIGQYYGMACSCEDYNGSATFAQYTNTGWVFVNLDPGGPMVLNGVSYIYFAGVIGFLQIPEFALTIAGPDSYILSSSSTGLLERTIVLMGILDGEWTFISLLTEADLPNEITIGAEYGPFKVIIYTDDPLCPLESLVFSNEDCILPGDHDCNDHDVLDHY